MIIDNQYTLISFILNLTSGCIIAYILNLEYLFPIIYIIVYYINVAIFKTFSLYTEYIFLYIACYFTATSGLTSDSIFHQSIINVAGISWIYFELVYFYIHISDDSNSFHDNSTVNFDDLIKKLSSIKVWTNPMVFITMFIILFINPLFINIIGQYSIYMLTTSVIFLEPLSRLIN